MHCIFIKKITIVSIDLTKREVEMFFGLKGQFHKIFDTSFFNKKKLYLGPIKTDKKGLTKMFVFAIKVCPHGFRLRRHQALCYVLVDYADTVSA